jgi:hypothetical protein
MLFGKQGRAQGATTPAEDDFILTDSSSEDSDIGKTEAEREQKPISGDETAPDLSDLRESLLDGLAKQKTAPQETSPTTARYASPRH